MGTFISKATFMQVRIGSYDVAIIQTENSQGWYAAIRRDGRLVRNTAIVSTRQQALAAARAWINTGSRPVNRLVTASNGAKR